MLTPTKMETVDFSTKARGRLAVLATHLSTIPADPPLTFSDVLEKSCVSSQSLVPPPPNLKGSITIVDDRTGKNYQIPVSEDGTVKATDFKKVT